VHPLDLDLTTARGAEQALGRTVEWGGAVHAVAHTVGGYAGGARIHETDPELWERMIALNLRSAWLVARSAASAMLAGGRGGSMVFVSARAALHGRRGHAPYAVSKAGVLTLVEALAEEYRDEGIRANAVLPGTLDTPANRRAMPDADASLWTPLAEVARVVRFLASDESAPVSGASVPVYGRS
jgi:NAD(P)-dependent dehydrogenase (short-subunit alcohol dehydrogenase family)